MEHMEHIYTFLKFSTNATNATIGKVHHSLVSALGIPNVPGELV